MGQPFPPPVRHIGRQEGLPDVLPKSECPSSPGFPAYAPKAAKGGFYLQDLPTFQSSAFPYQKKLRALALEATGRPDVMTEEAWNVLKEAGAQHNGEFVQFMGECDEEKRFAARFESETGEQAGNVRFGFYCLGMSRSDSQYVENYLKRLRLHYG